MGFEPLGEKTGLSSIKFEPINIVICLEFLQPGHKPGKEGKIRDNLGTVRLNSGGKWPKIRINFTS